MVPLLPHDHEFTKLYAVMTHDDGHNGVDTTMTKIRSHYWVVRLRRLVTSIRHSCIRCRKFEGEEIRQQMAPLPLQRLKPSPTWSSVGCNLFGPLKVKGEVQKRVRGKVYAVIFNCLVTRSVHLDLMTDSFLKVFRRFVSIRRYPNEIFSDCGSQRVAAKESIKGFGVRHGVEWTFSTPDAPWQNGLTESLIRRVKKSLFHVIGEQVLSYEELQTVLYEIANLMNERPIGKHPTSPESYLCPNNLLLGCSSVRPPSGPWCKLGNNAQRLRFVQRLTDQFWQKWTQDYFLTLTVRKKWHVEHRKLKKGDVVVKEENVNRGQWRLGRVSEVYPDSRGLVRSVELKTTSESGRSSQVKRAVQRLILLIPVEQQ
ncbi:uncharacterized protein LOC117113494 [Anneissia japonica]|uniref:uncharacterized protein LOC117113494 n=1 Tax=Anneissia japonica TaxID=1529436 RepID=UPI001425B0BD|nr:uncharacterized protein LOC117113494 [Anneissia japonica]